MEPKHGPLCIAYQADVVFFLVGIERRYLLDCTRSSHIKVLYQSAERRSMRPHVIRKVVTGNVRPQRRRQVAVVAQVVHLAINVSNEAIQVFVFVHVDAERLRVPNAHVECGPEEAITRLGEVIARHWAVLLVARVFPELHACVQQAIVVPDDAVNVIVTVKLAAERCCEPLRSSDDSSLVGHVRRIELIDCT